MQDFKKELLELKVASSQIRLHFRSMPQLKISLQNLGQKISLNNAAIILIIIVGALLVRLYGLSQYDFNDDELWHLTVASQDNLWNLITYNFREEVHPPLSYIVLHLMWKISHNDLWIRMSSIIPSILLIPTIYLFGRLYLGKAAGYAMAFLIAFGAMPVAIAEVVRAYSMMMLALVGAAIFVHKIQFSGDAKSRNKYRIYYFLCALSAIELNHAAIFTISALSLILAVQALIEKSKKDFAIISLMQVFLLILVAGYAFILKNFYGLGPVPAIFSAKDFAGYFMNYMTFYMWFPIGEQIKDSVSQIVMLIGVFSIFITPLVLFKNRKWRVLIIMMIPLILVTVADYFRFYPFSVTQRNNLFLFLSCMIGYGYFVQILANFLAKNYQLQYLQNRKFLNNILQISVVLILVFVASGYVLQRDGFRKIMPNCVEFGVTKNDTQNLWQRLEAKNKPDNVFVTIVRNIWYLRLRYGEEGHLEMISKNLGKFSADGFDFYFTALPPRERSITTSMIEYQVFFEELLAHLQEQKKIKQVKSFTFFDIGFNIDCLTRRFIPQMVSAEKDPFISTSERPFHQMWQEGYNIGWAMHTSAQVLDWFYFRDISYQCGRETFIISFTPKFIQDEFLNQKFVDGRKIYNEARLSEK